MAQDGFLFDELSEFKKDLLREMKDVFPKETQKFLKTEASKCAKVARNIAKRKIGTSKGKKKDWVESKSYHKKFKAGKIYDFDGDICCRAYNSSPVAHLIEYGHLNIPRGRGRATIRKERATIYKKREDPPKQLRGGSFTEGKLIIPSAEMEFMSDFLNDTEAFLYKYFDDTVGKR